MELQKQNRIDHISKMIFEIASGNYEYYVERTQNEDELDAIVVGINMLREELKATTVSRDYMNNLLKGVVDLIFVLDQDFTIQCVNEAVEELLGFNKAELAGKNFITILEQNSRIAFDTVQRGLQENKFIKDIEFRISTKNNVCIPASSSLSVLYDKWNQKNGILVIAKDISRLKQQEDEMRKAKERAEEANIAKSRFLANMSHEILTPLNGILGITEVMMNENPAQSEYLELIRSSGQNLSKLINDILDLSKIESGKLNLEKIAFPFAKTIQENIQSYKYLAEQKGLAFRCSIDDTIPASVIGDPSRINQIIVNLVGNAIKFTEHGSVDVHFTMVNQANGEITLQGEVKDTGIGIPVEKEKLIFQSFSQADDSITRKYGGTGLGLTIVDSLLKQMGGSIDVISPYNEKNHGTLFRFTFKLEAVPALTATRTSEKKSNANLSFSQPIAILVVDDNDINRLVARKILESFGATVTLAPDGPSALKLMNTKSFDMIFMDIQMPVMDGYETTTAIRIQNFVNPIIALSANAFDEHIQKSMDAGMNGHLAKPFTPEQMYNVVTTYVVNKRNDELAA